MDNLDDVIQTFDFPVLQRRLNALGFKSDEIELFKRIYDRNWRERAERVNFSFPAMLDAYKQAYTETARIIRVVIDYEQRKVE